MKRTPLSLKLDKLRDTPLEAMLWHLNEAYRNELDITADNMRFCTDLAINEALSLLEQNSWEMFNQTVAMMEGIT